MSEKTLSTLQNEPTYAKIGKNKPAEGNQDILMHVWGRFWGAKEKLACAFYFKFDLSNEKPLAFRMACYEKPSQIQSLKVAENPRAMHDQLPADLAQSTVPNATIQIIQTNFMKPFSTNQNLKKIRTILQENDSKNFQDWTYKLLSKIITKGKLNYQVYGELTSDPSKSSEKKNKKTSENGQSEQKSTEEKSADAQRQLAIETSAVKGIKPDDLNVGQSIFVRAMGDVVKYLPENLVEEERPDVSVPLEAEVLDIQTNPSLPPNIQGQSKDYYAIKVQFLNSNNGTGYVYKDEKVRSPEAPQEKESSTPIFLSPELLTASGAILLILVIAAYFLFGY